MGALQKIVFADSLEGGIVIELCDNTDGVYYVFNDPEETFNTLQIVAQCLEGDLEAKGIQFADGYDIVCQGACENMMAKFSEPQLRAIMRVLYEHDLPSDLDVLAQEIQLRMR
ncbi:hypothetical protein [Slackia heliotrinireducens]|jgi:hypothetical protein|uniref:hypothetical protein n=1 Tax=Slackia heliotrinireducens TaxID=84110 RepID=UPI0033163C94